LAAEPWRGSNVQDDYVLLEQIGQRAGKVFRAQHVREQRQVVVRIWRAPDLAARDRFVALAKVARSVRHPVLPAIEAFGYHGDNACYVVSECGRGEPLDRWTDRMGIPSVAGAIELFQRICVGLNAAHRNGLSHDALNPRNVWVTESDSDPLRLLEPCVLDLGVPAFVRAFPPSLRAARFMAPEQLARALNERALPAADVRMNVYSCGSLLHYVCTGGTPFLGRTLEEFAHAQTAGQLVPPSRINPQVPPALEAVIMRALAHDPNERYASMAELAHALERVRTGTGASGVRPRIAEASLSVFEPGRFDERPTSEAPRLPPIEPAPLPQAPTRAPVAVANSQPPPAARLAPAGLFSSAPPAASETSGEDWQRSARASTPGAERAKAPRTSTFAPRSIAAASHARSINRAINIAIEREWVRLHREWKRLHPETKRWLIASVTAVAAIALALRLAQLPAKAPDVLQPPVQGAQPAFTTPREVAPAAAPAAARVPAPVAVPAAANVAVPVAMPVAVPVPASVPVRAPVAAAASPRLPVPTAFVPASTLAPAKLRGRGLVRDASTLRSPSQASAQLTVQPHEPALEIKQAEPVAAIEPDAPAATRTEVPSRDASPPTAPASPAGPAAVHATAPDTATAPQPRKPVPLAAHARTSELVVHGSVATSVVRRAIERMTAQLEACYARSAVAAGRNGFGASQVEIEIDEHGRAREARAQGAPLRGLDACVAQAARSLVADRPPDTGRVQASFKVAFTP
jgi:serine/threonine protein kinase